MTDSEARKGAENAKSAKRFLEPNPELNDCSHRVIAAALTVHRTLGPGFLESVYEEALCIELHERGISFRRQFPISVSYKAHQVGDSRLDLLVETRLVVELKSVERIVPVHTAQVRAYLRATGCLLGLLVNFNVPRLRDGIERIVCSW